MKIAEDRKQWISDLSKAFDCVILRRKMTPKMLEEFGEYCIQEAKLQKQGSEEELVLELAVIGAGTILHEALHLACAVEESRK